MKKNIYKLGVFVLLCSIISSCIKDDSVGLVNNISTISLETDRDTLNINFGFPLVVEPTIEQSMADMELSYEWSYNSEKKPELKMISNDKILNYRFREAGEKKLRLKISNKHTAIFKYFTVFVNTEFEEGIIIMSNDNQNKCNISFMKKLSAEELLAGKVEEFIPHCIKMVNPGYDIKNAVDFDRSNGYLYITTSLDQKIYLFDHKTFDLLTVIDLSKEFPELIPKQTLSLLDIYSRGNINYILGENGKVYYFDPGILSVVESSHFGEGHFDHFSEQYSTGRYGYMNGIYLIDYENSRVHYSSSTYRWTGDQLAGQNIISVCKNSSNSTVNIIARSNEDPTEIIVSNFSYSLSRYNHPETVYYKSEYRYNEENFPLSKGHKILPNKTYNCAYFFIDNGLYLWYYNNLEEKIPTTPIITIPEGMEITSIDCRQDEEKLYVGVYDPSSSEDLKGSLYIYNCADIGVVPNLQPEKVYENIADKINTVFYKVKFED